MEEDTRKDLMNNLHHNQERTTIIKTVQESEKFSVPTTTMVMKTDSSNCSSSASPSFEKDIILTENGREVTTELEKNQEEQQQQQMSQLLVGGGSDDESQRKSSISFDKIKQISLTYSLQSDESLTRPSSPTADEMIVGSDTYLEAKSKPKQKEEEVGTNSNSATSSGCGCLWPAGEGDECGGERVSRKVSVIELKKGRGVQTNQPPFTSTQADFDSGSLLVGEDSGNNNVEEEATVKANRESAGRIRSGEATLRGYDSDESSWPNDQAHVVKTFRTTTDGDGGGDSGVSGQQQYPRTNPFAYYEEPSSFAEIPPTRTRARVAGRKRKAIGEKCPQNRQQMKQLTTYNAPENRSREAQVRLSDDEEESCQDEKLDYYLPPHGEQQQQQQQRHRISTRFGQTGPRMDTSHISSNSNTTSNYRPSSFGSPKKRNVFSSPSPNMRVNSTNTPDFVAFTPSSRQPIQWSQQRSSNAASLGSTSGKYMRQTVVMNQSNSFSKKRGQSKSTRNRRVSSADVFSVDDPSSSGSAARNYQNHQQQMEVVENAAEYTSRQQHHPLMVSNSSKNPLSVVLLNPSDSTSIVISSKNGCLLPENELNRKMYKVSPNDWSMGHRQHIHSQAPFCSPVAAGYPQGRGVDYLISASDELEEEEEEEDEYDGEPVDLDDDFEEQDDGSDYEYHRGEDSEGVGGGGGGAVASSRITGLNIDDQLEEEELIVVDVGRENRDCLMRDKNTIAAARQNQPKRETNQRIPPSTQSETKLGLYHIGSGESMGLQKKQILSDDGESVDDEQDKLEVEEKRGKTICQSRSHDDTSTLLEQKRRTESGGSCSKERQLNHSELQEKQKQKRAASKQGCSNEDNRLNEDNYSRNMSNHHHQHQQATTVGDKYSFNESQLSQQRMEKLDDDESNGSEGTHSTGHSTTKACGSPSVLLHKQQHQQQLGSLGSRSPQAYYYNTINQQQAYTRNSEKLTTKINNHHEKGFRKQQHEQAEEHNHQRPGGGGGDNYNNNNVNKSWPHFKSKAADERWYWSNAAPKPSYVMIGNRGATTSSTGSSKTRSRQIQLDELAENNLYYEQQWQQDRRPKQAHVSYTIPHSMETSIYGTPVRVAAPLSEGYNKSHHYYYNTILSSPQRYARTVVPQMFTQPAPLPAHSRYNSSVWNEPREEKDLYGQQADCLYWSSQPTDRVVDYQQQQPRQHQQQRQHLVLHRESTSPSSSFVNYRKQPKQRLLAFAEMQESTGAGATMTSSYQNLPLNNNHSPTSNSSICSRSSIGAAGHYNDAAAGVTIIRSATKYDTHKGRKNRMMDGTDEQEKKKGSTNKWVDSQKQPRSESSANQFSHTRQRPNMSTHNEIQLVEKQEQEEGASAGNSKLATTGAGQVAVKQAAERNQQESSSEKQSGTRNNSAGITQEPNKESLPLKTLQVVTASASSVAVSSNSTKTGCFNSQQPVSNSKVDSNSNNNQLTSSQVLKETTSTAASSGNIHTNNTTTTTIPSCPLFAQSPPAPKKPIKLKNLITGEQTVDHLYSKYKPNNKSHGCNDDRCLGSMLNPKPVEHKVRSVSETLEQAKDFISNFYSSIKRLDSPAHKNRLAEIEQELQTTGTYYLKETELIYGAKLAWRNAARCIGRIQWSKLQVFDARFTTTATEMFEAICNHIKYATNKGSLRSAITILPQRVKSTNQDWRIWNSQLIGYAGYKNAETGEIIGDPANADFTECCQKLGWKGKGGRFDILPIVLQAAGGAPELFPLPEDLVLQVKIKHPKYKWFEELGYQWYALPAVSSMMLDVGGLQFTAAPFSGWYMVTEIGTRDLGDVNRYNVLEEVAQRMGLNTTSNMSLWKDQAVVELNIAVLDSFQQAGVTIVDHHTATDTFMTHLANEQRLRGGCPADWVWLVPPTSGSTTQVYHQEMVSYHLLPNYEYMDPVYKNFDWLLWEKQQLELMEASKKRTSSIASVLDPNSPTCGLRAVSLSPLSPASRKVIVAAAAAAASNGGELTPRKLRFKEIARAVKFTSKLFGKALSRRIKATILYATETGKSERFANKLAQTFSCAFNVHLMSMSDYDMTLLEHEALLLVVTSTFGNGDPPENGELFAKHLAAVKLTGDTSPDIDSINSVSTNPFFQMLSEDHKDSLLSSSSGPGSSSGVGGSNSAGSGGSTGTDFGAPASGGIGSLRSSADHEREMQLKVADKQEQQTNVRPLSNVRFGVFALGSTAYPHFCAFGRYVDQTLGELGAERIMKCTCGDELCGQEKAFNEWSNQVFKTACDVFCLTDSIGRIEERTEVRWSPQDVKFVPVELIPDSTDHQAPNKQAQQQQTSSMSPNHNADTARKNLELSQQAAEDEQMMTMMMNQCNGNTTRTLVSNNNITTVSNKTKQQLEQQQKNIITAQSSSEVLTSKKVIVRNLMNITNKKIIPFTVKQRTDLHQFIPEENLQTLCIDLESDRISVGTGGNSVSNNNQQPMTSKTTTSNSHNALVKQATTTVGPTGLITFEAGDHVAIYPTNKLEMVEKILQRMESDLAPGSIITGSGNELNNNTSSNKTITTSDSSGSPSTSPSTTKLLEKQTSLGGGKFRFDQVYTILVKRENMDLTPAASMTPQGAIAAANEADQWITHDRLPVTSIRDALTRYLDITSPPNQEFLLILSRLTTDSEERKALQQMARNFTIYEEWKIKKVPTLLSVLEEFKTIRFVPALITQIPLMKPRFYSVSGTLVSLTLGVVRFKTQTGESREGLCSNYLNTVPIDPSTYIYGYIRSAPAFHMPQDKSIPMILISAGTGIAPFRAFWQQRYADMYKQNSSNKEQQQQQQQVTITKDNKHQLFGRMDMYFGCRNSNYILYKDELDEMYDKGVLSSINIAFSRPRDCDVFENQDTVSTDIASKGLNSSISNGSSNANMPPKLPPKPDGLKQQTSQPRVMVSKVVGIKQARKKMYVQDKLLEDSDEIFRLIMLDGAHVYVCGDVAMADGVCKTLATIFNNSLQVNRLASKCDPPSDDSAIVNRIAASDLAKSSDDGESVLMNLRNLNRYHEDIFGAKQMS